MSGQEQDLFTTQISFYSCCYETIGGYRLKSARIANGLHLSLGFFSRDNCATTDDFIGMNGYQTQRGFVKIYGYMLLEYVYQKPTMNSKKIIVAFLY